MINYPILFQPIFFPKIWGGQELHRILWKSDPSQFIGESWEISGIDNHVSIVANGLLKGLSLAQLIKEYKGDFVGRAIYNEFRDQFPLLIKFIDANKDLSIQLHPDDELAKQRHQSFGKTEMWYIVDAKKDARIIAGLKKDTTVKEYLEALSQDQLEKLLQDIHVQKGDTFYIAPGTIHAIGAGVVLAEIQQTSDITYRLYDWGRTDVNGNARELHTDLALDAISFKQGSDIHLPYDHEKNKSNLIKTCPYFTTNFLPVSAEIEKDYSNLDSFVIYICVNGKAEISIGNQVEKIGIGNTVLIPAMNQKVHIKSEYVELLEIHL